MGVGKKVVERKTTKVVEMELAFGAGAPPI